jgi:hypothetical protein
MKFNFNTVLTVILVVLVWAAVYFNFVSATHIRM